MKGEETVLQRLDYGSPLYELSKAFREQILRKPLGIILSEEDLKGEDQQIHFAAISESQIVGTVVLKPLPDQKVKLRQMAISPSHEGQGLGRKLILMAEEFACESGYKSIEMTARCSAQGFYERLGYETSGQVFVEAAVPVPSIIMSKTIN